MAVFVGDNQDIAQRIHFSVEVAKNNKKQVSDLLIATGISRAQLSRYNNGTNEPTVSKMVSLAEFCEVDLNWLITGEGEPFQTKPYVDIAFHDHSEESGPVKFERDYLEKVLRLKEDDCLMYTNTSDAMINRGIYNGSLVLVDLNHKRGDDVYLITINQDTMVRRLQFMPGGKVKVISDNESYEDYTLAEDEVTVIGRVAWVGGGR
ncbi:XRE family transcriptional regulator [Endozoicomonas ascidiicola]|uniref:XRE family transcriptional regulator n=1 Tax=Endozoicomonas ascidiicola TaxID=1698521 RepID=UPI000833C300|nr:LexA family transcriptional regulator [Endozoicomonas ascidiicola]